jgi:hypothetical protein
MNDTPESSSHSTTTPMRTDRPVDASSFGSLSKTYEIPYTPPCQRGYHSWDLRLPINDEAYAFCSVCGLQTTPEIAQANLKWQDRQLRP